jgi:hypothetical protein
MPVVGIRRILAVLPAGAMTQTVLLHWDLSWENMQNGWVFRHIQDLAWRGPQIDFRR